MSVFEGKIKFCGFFKSSRAGHCKEACGEIIYNFDFIKCFNNVALVTTAPFSHKIHRWDFNSNNTIELLD